MKLYQVVCADPAWQPNDKLPGKSRGATKNYKTMPTQAICDLAHWYRRTRKYGDPALELHMSGRTAGIARDAILFLWRLSSMQIDALNVIKDWGFTQKSELVWVKHFPCGECEGTGIVLKLDVHCTTNEVMRRCPQRHACTPFLKLPERYKVYDQVPCGECKGTGCGTPAFGMGRTVRNAHETCLIATRGKMNDKIKSHSIRSVLHAPMPVDKRGRPVHSAKPERFYTDVVEKLVDGPYLELFSRVRRRGWTTLGNQVGARRA